MTTYLTVTPAYGRDYKSLKAAKEDWQDGKDFVETTSGQYINRAQVVEMKQKMNVMVRYKKLTMISLLEQFK